MKSKKMEAERYRHQAHAANRADLIKHLALMSLAECEGLDSVWDAFAAMPAYPLLGLSSPRREMLNDMMRASGPPALGRLQAAVDVCCDAEGRPCYPGSGWLLSRLPSVRRLLFTDRDPACASALRHRFAADERITVRCVDVYEQAGAIPAEAPRCVFIDPPFVQAGEWPAVLRMLAALRRRGASTLLWYPLRDDLPPPRARWGEGDWELEVAFEGAGALRGCALHFSGFEPSLRAAIDELAAWLAQVEFLRLKEVRVLP